MRPVRCLTAASTWATIGAVLVLPHRIREGYPMFHRAVPLILLLLLIAPSTVIAQGKAKAKSPPERPEPTVADFAYGHDSPRQVFDFWQADREQSEKPTPVVLLIHGGGWQNGDKTGYGESSIQPFLDAGISVAAINYRFIPQAMEQQVEPPVKACLHDAARRMQTIRSKAKEWNVDPNANRGDRRFGGRLHVAVAGDARRPGRSRIAATRSRGESYAADVCGCAAVPRRRSTRSRFASGFPMPSTAGMRLASRGKAASGPMNLSCSLKTAIRCCRGLRSIRRSSWSARTTRRSIWTTRTRSNRRPRGQKEAGPDALGDVRRGAGGEAQATPAWKRCSRIRGTRMRSMGRPRSF